MKQMTLPTLDVQLRIRVVLDDHPTSPREWDNLGTMVCFHPRHMLGDEQPNNDPGEYRLALAERFEPGLEGRLERAVARRFSVASRQRDVDEYLIEAVDKVLARHIIELPLYLYDHSGLTMNTTGFSCPWDSGQVGFIYVPIAKIKEEYGWKLLTRKRKEMIHSMLIAEVQVYDDCLTGAVFGFQTQVQDNTTGEWEDEDSCYGFYGRDCADAISYNSGVPVGIVKQALADLDEWVMVCE